MTSSYLSWFHRGIVDSDEVSRDTVTPPQLPGDTPVPEGKRDGSNLKQDSLHTWLFKMNIFLHLKQFFEKLTKWMTKKLIGNHFDHWSFFSSTIAICSLVASSQLWLAVFVLRDNKLNIFGLWTSKQAFLRPHFGFWSILMSFLFHYFQIFYWQKLSRH